MLSADLAGRVPGAAPCLPVDTLPASILMPLPASSAYPPGLALLHTSQLASFDLSPSQEHIGSMGCQNPRKGHSRQWLGDLGEVGTVPRRAPRRPEAQRALKPSTHGTAILLTKPLKGTGCSSQLRWTKPASRQQGPLKMVLLSQPAAATAEALNLRAYPPKISSSQTCPSPHTNPASHLPV